MVKRRIKNGLFVGSCDDARRFGDEFDEVISLASPPESSTQQYLIDDGEHEYDIFREAVESIIESLEKDEEVLVHCNAGISRSVSACIAVSVVYFDMSYEDAFEICRSGFMYPNEELVDSAKKYISDNKSKDN